MRLTILGMNGPFPAAEGATSGYLVDAGDDCVCMDLGSGTLGALTALTPPEQLTALLLTHWHNDHCSDVLPLLYRLQATGSVLDVYGPADAQSPVPRLLERESCVRLHAVAPGDCLTLGGLQITAFAARHPVPALMYRLTDGRSTLCYTGDTNTVPHLADFAQGADLLLADGLFPTAMWTEAKPHLSAALCAETAVQAGARRLLITHLNPLLDEAGLLREARAVYPGAELARRSARYEF